MKNSFFLVIPTQQNNPQRLKEFGVKALQQWVAELPTANPGLATRLLHDFLIDFNTLEMTAQLRLDALELLSASVYVIEDYLRSRLIKTGFPKEDNDKKILSVLVSIEKEFTIGYWIVLKELTRRDVGWFQGKNTALAIQRCIKGLSSIVISHFIMGMPIPDWVWIDLHSLYNLSVTLKNSSTKVSNETSLSNKPSTPEECYRQILLLSLADPTGLMQKEILQVYSFIESINTLVSLKKDPVNGQQIQCIVLTDEDKSPHCQIETGIKNDSAILYLDLTKLFKAFKQKEKLINAAEARFSSMHLSKSNAAKPAAELLDYLEQRWLGVDLQGVPFFSDRADRCIAVGLESTYELQHAIGSAGDKDLEFSVQSASERLLSGVFEQTGVLSVGSLVSFRKSDSPEHKRSLGIVNKVIVDRQSGRINFGMQLLAHQSIAVTYVLLEEASKDIPPQKGLFYSAKELDYEKSYIITASFMLKDGDIIRMMMNNDDFPVVLSNRKNVGLGYWQFECRRVAAEKDKSLPSHAKKGYDFI
ncbi:MAG: hypothetical protein Q8Q50_14355 [Methylobacter sp.]|nr:hypothetical protein [Methylobacter sp.]